ncbi:MAG TPA: hypothetical protein VEP90_10200 [Methylomirabilota bacterium]|nr:hypothetical protein [Methylomirabilota bacterium]
MPTGIYDHSASRFDVVNLKYGIRFKDNPHEYQRRQREAYHEKRLAHGRQYYWADPERKRRRWRNWLMKPGNKERTLKTGRCLRRNQAEEFRKWKEFAGPCKCGMGDGRVLEYHHLNPKEKKFGINVLNWYQVSLKDLLDEIAKCEVLCRNCHTIEEFENGVWKVN